MDDYIEIEAKTVDDAITEATVQMGLTSDQIEYEVIDKGASGFLGRNSKMAKIRVRKKEERAEMPEEIEPEEDEPALAEARADAPQAEPAAKPKREKTVVPAEEVEAEIRSFLGKVHEAMGLSVELTITPDPDEVNAYDVDMVGDDMGMLIGKRGQTLDALQYLTNLAINKHLESYVRVKLDTEDYRRRRKATLENLAKNVAYKVKRTGNPVELEPMNPYERRVIHFALQNDRYVTTHSEGEGDARHVVVTLREDAPEYHDRKSSRG